MFWPIVKRGTCVRPVESERRRESRASCVKAGRALLSVMGLAMLWAVVWSAAAQATVFMVVNTNDNGRGSLRAAINQADATPGPDAIHFTIGHGAQTITPRSALPDLTDSVVIDGSTQPGFSGTPLIRVDGSHAGVSAGLVIAANSSAVRAVELTGWSSGIVIASATGNAIGGSRPGSGNVISANRDGVEIFGSGAKGNVVAGNHIGTDTTGTRALGNALVGIDIFDSAAHNTIGGLQSGSGNVISANRDGLDIYGRANGNLVAGNHIGTDAAGRRALGNALAGIAIFGGAYNNTIGVSHHRAENVISANRDGLDIFGGSTNNVVAGNYIGTDAVGRRALGNTFTGVSIFGGAHDNTVGGPKSGDRNVISANHSDGVDVFGGAAGNVVAGNYIGTDAVGRRALGNTFDGVDIFGGAHDNTVGGPKSGDRNVISANHSDGVDVFGGAAGNVLAGNYIGINAAGKRALGNAFQGVAVYNGANRNTVGGANPGDRNVISANHDDGIDISDKGTRVNRVSGNYIGTDGTGRLALGNTNEGVDIFNGANRNTVGGANPGGRNVISANHDDGIDISDKGTRVNRVRATTSAPTARAGSR